MPCFPAHVSCPWHSTTGICKSVEATVKSFHGSSSSIDTIKCQCVSHGFFKENRQRCGGSHLENSSESRSRKCAFWDFRLHLRVRWWQKVNAILSARRYTLVRRMLVCVVDMANVITREGVVEGEQGKLNFS